MTRSSRLFNSGVIPKPRVFSSEARNLPFELLRPFRAYRFASVFRCAPCVFLFYMSQFFLPTANPPTKQCFTMSTLPREPPLESQVIFTPPAPHRATQPRRPRFRSKAFSRDRPPHQRRRRHVARSGSRALPQIARVSLADCIVSTQQRDYSSSSGGVAGLVSCKK